MNKSKKGFSTKSKHSRTSTLIILIHLHYVVISYTITLHYVTYILRCNLNLFPSPLDILTTTPPTQPNSNQLTITSSYSHPFPHLHFHLSGAWLKDYAKSLVGVDLSEQMVNLARKKMLYQELHVDSLDRYCYRH